MFNRLNYRVEVLHNDELVEASEWFDNIKDAFDMLQEVAPHLGEGYRVWTRARDARNIESVTN